MILYAELPVFQSFSLAMRVATCTCTTSTAAALLLYCCTAAAAAAAEQKRRILVTRRIVLSSAAACSAKEIGVGPKFKSALRLYNKAVQLAFEAILRMYRVIPPQRSNASPRLRSVPDQTTVSTRALSTQPIISDSVAMA